MLSLLLLLGCRDAVLPPGPSPEADPSLAWRKLIKQASGKDGVNYSLIRTNRQKLDDYLAWIAEHGPRTDKMKLREEDRKISFYVNAYNALVVQSVLELEPLESVRDLKGGLIDKPGAAFFFNRVFKVDGEWMSLLHLEHERLLAAFQEPLIHAALNCASVGCPPLRYWTKSGLEKNLKSAMKEFLNSEKGAKKIGEDWQFSEIFSWYEKDFVEWSRADNLCLYLQEFADEKLAFWLKSKEEACSLDYFPYDWSINKK